MVRFTAFFIRLVLALIVGVLGGIGTLAALMTFAGSASSSTGLTTNEARLLLLFVALGIVTSILLAFRQQQAEASLLAKAWAWWSGIIFGLIVGGLYLRLWYGLGSADWTLVHKLFLGTACVAGAYAIKQTWIVVYRRSR